MHLNSHASSTMETYLECVIKANKEVNDWTTHIPAEVSWAAILYTGWLKQQKVIFSYFWRLESPGQGLAAFDFWWELSSGLQMATFLLSPYTALPLCPAVFSISLSPSLPKTITSGVRVSTYQFGRERGKGRDTNIQSITRGNTCLDWVVRKHELFSEAWVQNTEPGLKQYGNSF